MMVAVCYHDCCPSCDNCHSNKLNQRIAPPIDSDHCRLSSVIVRQGVEKRSCWRTVMALLEIGLGSRSSILTRVLCACASDLSVTSGNRCTPSTRVQYYGNDRQLLVHFNSRNTSNADRETCTQTRNLFNCVQQTESSIEPR